MNFKYELGQIVHYVMGEEGNKVAFCSAPVLARRVIENQHEDWAHTKEQCQTFTPFGPAGVWYATCHGTFPEQVLFPDKRELVEALAATS